MIIVTSMLIIMAKATMLIIHCCAAEKICASKAGSICSD